MHALQVLEFPEVLAGLSRQAETSVGRARALDLTPTFDPEVMRILLAQTEEAVDLLEGGPVSLRGVHDLVEKLSLVGRGAVLDGESLHRIGELLRVGREVQDRLRGRRDRSPQLARLSDRMHQNRKLETRLADSLESDGSVRSEASPALASARERRAGLARRLTERIQAYTTGRFRDLLSDPVVTQRSGRQVIPLKAENRGKIRGIVHDTSASGATIYLEPEDVVRTGNELREAEAAERTEVERVLRRLSEMTAEESAALTESLEALAELDVVLAKARLGSVMQAVVPGLLSTPGCVLKNARHPLLEPRVAVPLSLSLGAEAKAILITGPNTGGKTISIKTVGLAAAMAQCGMMVPADEARIGCFRQIWADIGDEQSLQQSLSTFSAHIRNIALAVNGLEPGALVLLDEVGAGTDPAEGAALAQALLQDLKDRGALILASTHYGELKLFAGSTPGFVNAGMEFDRRTLRPTYRLMVGVPGSSQALHIASRYGMPERIIEAARARSEGSEQDLGRLIQSLEDSQRRARESQSRADRLSAELDRLRKATDKRLSEAEEARRTVRTRVADEMDEALRALRLEAEDIFAEVKRNPTPTGIEKARKKLARLQEKGRGFVKDVRPKEAPAPSADPDRLVRGAQVRIDGIGQVGTVLEEPKRGKVQVQIGAMKMSVEIARLQLAGPPPARKSAPAAGQGVRRMMMEKSQQASTEINLISLRAEEAQSRLLKFLEDAVLGGLPWVRIVHGKGEGILRSLVEDTLRRDRNVVRFVDADSAQGGHGATVAYFE
ncbi:MAG: endonuclease MutS2 [Fimbriimonadaceae bacterium]|nr:endonuclease MutS2 [Fimbriimonadaceae bacterium]